ncbi:MAG TPA: alpha/beta hydrolase [Steroidobacter sp.]|uniref:alpha/beta hydrolase n=1 Tax=Steroidobacter sp. TaxID=1978227 RepID=UPI002ED80B0C
MRSNRGRWFLTGTGIVLASAVLLALVGCVSGKTYRTRFDTAALCTASSSEDCPGDILHVLATDPVVRKPALMSYVEFDDQGYPREPQSKKLLIEELESLANDHPLLLVVFAHGWKHNAAAGDTNVESFQSLLRKLAAADAAACTNAAHCRDRQVVGIYMGWRGLSNSLEPFKSLTFWARKGRAHRVGMDGGSELLAELSRLSRQKRARNHEGANRLVITGHSFGGALVYTALSQALLRGMPLTPGEPISRDVANLIVLVNPAFEAARFESIHRKSQVAFAPGQKPVLAIFTSQGDKATEMAFPLGRKIATLFSEHRDSRQRAENVTAVGHYEPFQTHTLRVVEPSSISLRAAACAWEGFTRGDVNEWHVGELVLRRTPEQEQSVGRFSPYLNVAVDDAIVRGHNGIWEQTFADFLYYFVAAQEARSCATPVPVRPEGE